MVKEQQRTTLGFFVRTYLFVLENGGYRLVKGEDAKKIGKKIAAVRDQETLWKKFNLEDLITAGDRKTRGMGRVYTVKMDEPLIKRLVDVLPQILGSKDKFNYRMEANHHEGANGVGQEKYDIGIAERLGQRGYQIGQNHVTRIVGIINGTTELGRKAKKVAIPMNNGGYRFKMEHGSILDQVIDNYVRLIGGEGRILSQMQTDEQEQVDRSRNKGMNNILKAKKRTVCDGETYLSSDELLKKASNPRIRAGSKEVDGKVTIPPEFLTYAEGFLITDPDDLVVLDEKAEKRVYTPGAVRALRALYLGQCGTMWEQKRQKTQN